MKKIEQSLINKSITHIREQISKIRKVEDRVAKLRYFGYNVQERYLTKYNGVGKVSHKPNLGEYLVTIGQGKNHNYNQVYAVVLYSDVKTFAIKCMVNDVECYLATNDSILSRITLTEHIEEAKIFDKLDDAKYVSRGINDMEYSQGKLISNVIELK